MNVKEGWNISVLGQTWVIDFAFLGACVAFGGLIGLVAVLLVR